MLSGCQPYALLVSPYNLTKVVTATATTTERTAGGTRSVADPMWRHASTPASASRRGIFSQDLLTNITDQRRALATPPVRESWSGVGRRLGRRKNVHQASQDVFTSAAWRGATEQISSLASALRSNSRTTAKRTTVWTEVTKIHSKKQT